MNDEWCFALVNLLVQHAHTVGSVTGAMLRCQEHAAVRRRRSQHSQECKDPRQQCFCDSWPWPLTFWPQNKIGFQHSSWNISVSSLVILAASVFEISWGKTDTQTNGGKRTLSRDYVCMVTKSVCNFKAVVCAPMYVYVLIETPLVIH